MAATDSPSHILLRHHVYSQLSPFGLVSVLQKLMRSDAKLSSSKLRRTFLRNCKDEQVLPTRFNLLASVNSRGEAWPHHWDATLADEINNLNEEVEAKWRNRRKASSDFDLVSSVLPPDLVNDCFRLLRENTAYIADAQTARQSSKLKGLCERSLWSMASLTETVVNLSSHVLTDAELHLLGLGLSFSMPSRSDTCIDVLTAINQLQSRARHLAPELLSLKGLAITGFKDLTLSQPGLPKRLRLALASLQSNHNIMILKADKGSTTTIFDKASYLRSGEQMLADANVYEPLKKNPLATEQSRVNIRLREIFSGMGMSVQPLPFKIFLPVLAYCYFSPKLHKDPISYRPIVSQRQAFTARLARHLSSILTPTLGSFSPAHLRDSTHLKAMLLEKADPSLPFISLDVDALFTNVPLEPLLGFLHRKHDQGGLPLPPGYTILGFLDLIRLCVGSSVFSFNGKFYRQKQGVTMDSPLPSSCHGMPLHGVL